MCEDDETGFADDKVNALLSKILFKIPKTASWSDSKDKIRLQQGRASHSFLHNRSELFVIIFSQKVLNLHLKSETAVSIPFYFY